MIKQNRALSSGCHTVARRLPLTAVSAPSSFTKRCYPAPAVPSIPPQRKVSGIQNQLFTAALRIFDHTVAVFVLDLSARSPTGPVELLLLIWTPASWRSNCLFAYKPASHRNSQCGNTTQSKSTEIKYRKGIFQSLLDVVASCHVALGEISVRLSPTVCYLNGLNLATPQLCLHRNNFSLSLEKTNI